MNVREIERLLGKTIFNRAVQYYKSDAVSDLEFHDNGDVTALVEGSRVNEYSVVVNVDEDYFDCDCPYDDYCKHIGAVLLAVYGTPAEKRAEPIKSDAQYRNAVEDALRRIDTRKVHEFPIDVNGPGSRNPDPYRFGAMAAVSNKRYRLVFLIEEDNYENMATIVPYNQYIKLNGEPGRIEKLDAARITEPLSTGTRRLYLSLMNRSTHYYNLDESIAKYLALIAVADDLPLFMKMGYNTIPVRPVELASIVVSFKLHGLKGKEPYFTPTLSATGVNGETVGDINPAVVDEHGTGMSIVEGSGALFYLLDEPETASAMIMLRRMGATITAKDIGDFTYYCREYCRGKVSVSFNKKRVRLISLRPECLIELDESRYGLDIHVLFKYGDREFPSTREEGILIMEEMGGDDEIVVGARSFPYEDAVVRHIFMMLRETRDIQSSIGRFTQPQDERTPAFRVRTGAREFLSAHGLRLIDVGYVLRMGKSGRTVRKGGGNVRYRVKSGIDWFDLEVTYADNSPESGESPLAVDADTFRHGIARAGGSYVVLSKKEVEELMMLSLEGLDEKGSARIHKSELAIINQVAERCVGEARDQVLSLSEIYEKLKSFTGIKEYAVPRDFNATLRPYQKAGFDWLNFLSDHGLNGCLADDMGLGKTVQALALLQSLKENGVLGLSLLIVPVTVIPNWINEIARFAPGLRVAVHYGPGRESDIGLLSDPDLIITSYHTLQRDAAMFQSREFHYCILDEAQQIKNAATKTFKVVRSIRARLRLSLTGTPVENNTHELWAQMDFLNPGLLGGRREFSRRFAGPIEKNGNKTAADALRKKVFPFILRRKKQDVAIDLPPREEIDVFVEMTDRQRAVYEKYRSMYRDKIGETLTSKGVGESTMEILEALLRLRQICLFPELVRPEYRGAGSGKFDILRDMLDEICVEDHKTLVFSQFVQALSIIRSHVDGAGYKYAYIDGATKKREKQIGLFQQDEKVKLFLLSIKAGGLGINLTAADYVIVFDPWWNPAVEDQAIDRTHRIGQKRKVIAYRLLTKNSVEEKIRQLQEKKKKLVRELISDEPSFFKSLGRDDIMKLFE